jgi:hypothetical protein
MSSSQLPQNAGSILNLAGPDLMIILLVFGMMAVVVGFVVSLTRGARRPPASSPPTLPVATSCADRIRQLDELRQKQLISDSEYEEQRRRILSSI